MIVISSIIINNNKTIVFKKFDAFYILCIKVIIVGKEKK